MKRPVISVLDSKIKVYERPTVVLTLEQALRDFKDACNDQNSRYGKHPEDYTLFHIGTYYEDRGVFENLKTPHSLGLGVELKESVQ